MLLVFQSDKFIKLVLKNVIKLAKDSLNNIFKDCFNKILSQQLTHDRSYMSYSFYIQCENLNDSEHMTWVIINHVRDLIELCEESPVQDFIR